MAQTRLSRDRLRGSQILGRALRTGLGSGPGRAFLIFAVLMAISSTRRSVLTAFQLQTISDGTAALALVAIGATLVVLTGGLDLSAGAVMGLVNVILATHLAGDPAADALVVLVAFLVAGLAGLANGVFVGLLGVPSIIVTVATLFIFNGAALLILPQPGGTATPDFVAVFSGTILGVPRSLVLIVAGAGIWLLLKHTRFGLAIYAIGSDAKSAYLSGVPVRWVLVATYAVAGLFYGAAGIFLTAQIASGSPVIGSTSFLLTVFIAVILGGTRIGGGQGGAIGTVLGAFVVTAIVGVLFSLGVTPFFTGFAEGLVLLIAVVFSSLAIWFQRRPTRGQPAPEAA
jgi:Ribose/xylose/arabinose/galactoside ABC-type transport systems, permease components